MRNQGEVPFSFSVAGFASIIDLDRMRSMKDLGLRRRGRLDGTTFVAPALMVEHAYHRPSTASARKKHMKIYPTNQRLLRSMRNTYLAWQKMDICLCSSLAVVEGTLRTFRAAGAWACEHFVKFASGVLLEWGDR